MCCVCFFFKQKTAYEMRISDWSSDVCSSDLLLLSGHPIGPAFPLLLYYNQIVGSIVKIHVSFRLDQQSWTRQRTKLAASGDAFQTRFNWWSSQLLMFAAVSEIGRAHV